MRTDKFVARHIGPNEEEIKKMLSKINADSIEELLEETLPPSIRLDGPLDLERGISEFEFSKHIQALGRKNENFSLFVSASLETKKESPILKANQN